MKTGTAGLRQLARVSFDLVCMLAAWAVFMMLPESVMPAEALGGVMAIVLTKILVVSSGVLYAHASRKLLFSYIDFAVEKEWSNNAMIIGWYIVIIWAFARGG